MEAEEVDNEVDNEEEAPMIREQSSGDYRELLTPGYARYTPYRVRVAREEDTFFTPSTTPGQLTKSTNSHYLVVCIASLGYMYTYAVCMGFRYIYNNFEGAVYLGMCLQI